VHRCCLVHVHTKLQNVMISRYSCILALCYVCLPLLHAFEVRHVVLDMYLIKCQVYSDVGVARNMFIDFMLDGYMQPVFVLIGVAAGGFVFFKDYMVSTCDRSRYNFVSGVIFLLVLSAYIVIVWYAVSSPFLCIVES